MRKILKTILMILLTLFLLFVGLIVYLMFFDTPNYSSTPNEPQVSEYIEVEKINEKKVEGSAIQNAHFSIGTNDVSSFLSFLKDTKTDFSYKDYYGINDAYQIYQNTSYTKNTSSDLLDAQGKIDVDLLVKQVQKNNEAYLTEGKTAVSMFFKEMNSSEMRNICRIICEVSNAGLFNIPASQMSHTLSHLKMFTRTGSASNAYVSEELVFVFNPTMTSMYANMQHIQDDDSTQEDTYNSVIVHEIIHLLQYSYGDQVKENGTEAGFCRKYENNSSLWFSWLLEASAEIQMANYLGVEPGTYQKKISYANSYNLSRFNQTKQLVENSVFNPTIARAMDELNEKDIMDFLNLMYSIEITQYDPEEFWERYNQELSDEQKLEIRMQIRQEAVSEMTYHYYMGIINEMRKGTISDLNTLFYMMRLWEIDAYSHLEYTKTASLEAAKVFIEYQNEIQEKLFEIISDNLSLSIDELWNLYNSYSMNIDGHVNASLDYLKPIVSKVMETINTANFSRNKTMYDYITKEAN